MTVAELMEEFAKLAQVDPTAEVLIRVDSESLDRNPAGVFAVRSLDYSAGCTDTYALMVDCGLPEDEENETPLRAPMPTSSQEPQLSQQPNCMDCGLACSNMDMTLPRDQWLLINPRDGGMLCPSCMVVRASKQPHAVSMQSWIRFADSYPTPPDECQPYSIILTMDEERDWIAQIPELPGCISHGSTPSEAVNFLREMQVLWLDHFRESRQAIPPPMMWEEFSQANIDDLLKSAVVKARVGPTEPSGETQGTVRDLPVSSWGSAGTHPECHCSCNPLCGCACHQAERAASQQMAEALEATKRIHHSLNGAALDAINAALHSYRKAVGL